MTTKIFEIEAPGFTGNGETDHLILWACAESAEQVKAVILDSSFRITELKGLDYATCSNSVDFILPADKDALRLKIDELTVNSDKSFVEIAKSTFIGSGKRPWLVTGRIITSDDFSAHLILADDEHLAESAFTLKAIADADLTQEEVDEMKATHTVCVLIDECRALF